VPGKKLEKVRVWEMPMCSALLERKYATAWIMDRYCEVEWNEENRAEGDVCRLKSKTLEILYTKFKLKVLRTTSRRIPILIIQTENILKGNLITMVTMLKVLWFIIWIGMQSAYDRNPDAEEGENE
jgi:hypothetical protein